MQKQILHRNIVCISVFENHFTRWRKVKNWERKEKGLNEPEP
jgi:hypothetical protein